MTDCDSSMLAALATHAYVVLAAVEWKNLLASPWQVCWTPWDAAWPHPFQFKHNEAHHPFLGRNLVVPVRNAELF